ncbi:hypothetical protein R1flu_010633 [Riccia fluitans]|uniref:Uncharacterized protein n=1 Tax=Riccia fluitans TaxID=41844 RepID=A0ABD1Z5I7_9MARC
MGSSIMWHCAIKSKVWTRSIPSSVLKERGVEKESTRRRESRFWIPGILRRQSKRGRGYFRRFRLLSFKVFM